MNRPEHPSHCPPRGPSSHRPRPVVLERSSSDGGSEDLSPSTEYRTDINGITQTGTEDRTAAILDHVTAIPDDDELSSFWPLYCK
jgi:hypothetical protein